MGGGKLLNPHYIDPAEISIITLHALTNAMRALWIRTNTSQKPDLPAQNRMPII